MMKLVDSSRPVRFGMIGSGSIADFHARAIDIVDGAELVAVHSRTVEPGQTFAATHGCDYESSLDGLLARQEIDAVAITTPSGTHAEIGITAAKAGKHILCEKPIDVTTEKIDELMAVCEAQNVLLAGIFPSRFGAGPQATRKALREGRFGRLVQCSAHIPWYRTNEYYNLVGWRGTWALDGGGALMNQGIHAVDLLLWLVGDVEEVSARYQTRARAIEVEDNAVAWVRFKEGALGLIQASTVCYPGEKKRLEIKGERGSVTLLDDMPVFWQFEEDLPEDEEVRKLVDMSKIGGGFQDPKAISVEGHRSHYEDFVKALHTGSPPMVVGNELRRAVALIRAIYRSSETNSVIKLD